MEEGIEENVSEKILQIADYTVSRAVGFVKNNEEKKAVLEGMLSNQKEDVVVELLHLHEGMEERNPMDGMRFFEKEPTEDRIGQAKNRLFTALGFIKTETGVEEEEEVVAFPWHDGSSGAVVPPKHPTTTTTTPHHQRYIRVYSKAKKDEGMKFLMVTNAFEEWKVGYMSGRPRPKDSAWKRLLGVTMEEEEEVGGDRVGGVKGGNSGNNDMVERDEQGVASPTNGHD